MFNSRVNLSTCASRRLMLQSLSAFYYMRIHKFIQKLLNLSCHTGFALSSTNKSINLQQWDPRMLSLICDVEDDTAIAVQRDLHNLKCHISVLQLRKSHYLTSITSFFQPLGNLDSELVDLGTRRDVPGLYPGTTRQDVPGLFGKSPGTSRD